MFIALCGGCAAPAPLPNVNLSTPDAAALAYLTAIQRGDARTAQALSLGTPEQEQWPLALATLVDGMRRFDNALYDRFGRIIEQVHTDMNDALHGLADEPVDVIRNGQESDDGKTARIDPKHQGFTSHFQPSIYLKRDKEGWKVLLRETYGEGVPADRLPELSRNFGRYRQSGDAFKAVANEIRAGRYKTIDEASVALGKRLAAIADGK